MTPKITGVSEVSFPLDDVIHASLALIAASSQITALHKLYSEKGVLQAGALLHVGNVIDEVIHRLGLAEGLEGQEIHPF